MKQVIPFVKDVSLNSKISDITSIALEHNLKMENNDSIVGEFIISGKYKINDISVNEETFEKQINFDITLDDKYDASKVKIDVDDFYYEIINEESLRVHIDVLVDNLVYIENEKPVIEEQKEIELISFEDIKNESSNEEERNSIMNNDFIIEEKESTHKDNDSQIKTTNFSSDFFSQEEKYSMYKVHIIRQSDTIETIKEKYNILQEELEKYNDLQNIVLGTKIIVPINNE